MSLWLSRKLEDLRVKEVMVYLKN